MIELKNVSKNYGKRQAVRDVSLTIGQGEIVGLFGENGAGKSTLIKCMDRVLTPESGEVSVDGQSLYALSRREHARICAYVPQTPPKGTLTVFDAVLLGRRPYITWDASAHDKAVVMQSLELLHLEGYAMRRVDELSGGEQQKVAIARALAQQLGLDLERYADAMFEAGGDVSGKTAEEVFNTAEYARTVKVNDRATMLNLMVGLNGYTLCSGIICEELNGTDYAAVPFVPEGDPHESIMEVGYIVRKDSMLSRIGELYVREIKKYLGIASENLKER